MTPVLHRSYVSLSMKNIKTFWRVGWNRAAFYFMQDIFPKLLRSLNGKEVYCLRWQWLWHGFLHLEESGDYSPLQYDPVWLGRCIRSPKESLHATQVFHHLVYRGAFQAVSICTIYLLRWGGPPSKKSVFFWKPSERQIWLLETYLQWQCFQSEQAQHRQKHRMVHVKNATASRLRGRWRWLRVDCK